MGRSWCPVFILASSQHGRARNSLRFASRGATLAAILQAACAILVSGGSHRYLSFWFQQSGFADRLREMLDRAVYVGVLAWTMLVTPRSTTQPRGAGDHRGLRLVGFQIRPHVYSNDFLRDESGEEERAALSETR
jgi:peptidase E